MLRKLFPFLFKSKKQDVSPAAASHGQRNTRSSGTADTPSAAAYGIIAKNRNHRGLRKGSKIYVRQIFDDGQRLRVRGTAPNGRKVTLTVSKRSLSDFKTEVIPEHLVHHYKEHSSFTDEHEAKMKAETFNKKH